jgi:hypothetical protein
LSTTLSKIWLSVRPFFRSFDHNSLVSRPFLARKVSHRSSHHVLWNGHRSGQFDSALGLVNGPVKPWSNLVKFRQSPPNSGEMGPGLHFEGFWARWVLVGSETARSNLGQTLVKLGQTWSTLVKLGQTSGNMSQDLLLGSYLMWRALRRIRLGSVRAVSICVPTPEKIPGVKMGL